MNKVHIQTRDSREVVDCRGQLLNKLQLLLERQVDLARQGNLAAVSVLAKQVDAVVAQIGRLGVAETKEYEQRRRMIERLYDRLSLVLTTACSDIDNEVKRIRMGRKVLGAYRRNLRRL